MQLVDRLGEAWLGHSDERGLTSPDNTFMAKADTSVAAYLLERLSGTCSDQFRVANSAQCHPLRIERRTHIFLHSLGRVHSIEATAQRAATAVEVLARQVWRCDQRSDPGLPLRRLCLLVLPNCTTLRGSCMGSGLQLGDSDLFSHVHHCRRVLRDRRRGALCSSSDAGKGGVGRVLRSRGR